ncbi:phage major capsid protein [Priestia megaterium]|uniref:phage major capsid protein n=1 Tax=Priestia megaterium TaxID=1404 RepID=UPI0032D97280
MTEKIELRNFNVSLSEVEETSDGLFVRGLVNRPNSWSEPLTAKNGQKFIERIMPNAFSKALQRGNEIRFLGEHDPAKLLASTKNGSLKLEETNEGLMMEARISETSWGKDYHTLISDGLLTNMSFGFQALSDQWSKDNGMNQRSITDLYLAEVSCVATPAYSNSQIQARNLQSTEDIEIPQIEERDLSKMTVTQLEQAKTKIYNEYRSLDENSVEARNLLQQISDIDAQIQSLNKTIIPQGDVRNMENVLQNEVRALEDYIKGIDSEEKRTLTTGSSTGTAIIPEQISNQIVEKLFEVAPLFARTQNFKPVAGRLDIPVEDDLGDAAWVGEEELLNQTDYTLKTVTLDQKRVGSAIDLTKNLINDSGIDIVKYSTKVLTGRIGRAIDRAILNGDATKSFEGILNKSDITVAKTTASATAITLDELLDLYNSMNPQLIPGSVFIVSRNTFNLIAKFKDGNGHYHLVREVSDTGVIYKLFGQPVLVSDVMPDIATGAKAVLFVNLSEGYATMVKQGIELEVVTDVNNALSGKKTLVMDGFMDGKVTNTQAIKILKMA